MADELAEGRVPENILHRFDPSANPLQGTSALSLEHASVFIRPDPCPGHFQGVPVTIEQLDFGFAGATVPASPATKPPTKRGKVSTAAATPEEMARVLEQHPDYRVLRRLVPRQHFDHVPQGDVVSVIVLDTETTGLNQAQDKIIELAMLRVSVDRATGLPCGEVQVYDGLEDPGMPISSEIEAITGISNQMVKGQHLDEQRIATILNGADLVIAHNAAFDRPFVEARLPGFKDVSWGCSFAEIDWRSEGHGSSKLEYLAMDMGWFYDAHRAEVDCHALLAVLTATLPVSARTGLSRLLTDAQGPVYRLQATGAPFESKDALKARAYRWNAEQKVWHTLLTDATLLQAERDWLRTTVYGNRAVRVQLEELDARVKYSGRPGKLSQLQL
ncbi:MAG: DNA polymerase III subunit epsilon [Gammaproteobacteria bacterium]|nr:DNA polymerase III subunit epsilon [Gammaproteobacteria bacterium]MBU0786435.1 DNA polymerase III subunit epsilon [Gammaproteobacteria bacterium]MBU0816138.1 DNA polymerase III subunit epsilon [Gammaproteobacteria bacterium]MBU1787836.1 DNA polymerase III subunit epsilon [Gammaproteobacteria bacterium]